MEKIKTEREIIPGYPELAMFTGACVPNLRKLVNRKYDPLPSIKLSPRKIVFIREDVIRWMKEESARQAGGVA